MEVDIYKHEEKLKILLRKFLERDFRISDADLNVFLSHLSGKDDPDLGKALLSLDLFPEWIQEALLCWETNKHQPTQTITRFTLELVCLLSKHENKFNLLCSGNVYLRLVDLLNLTKDTCGPSVKLAFVKLLAAFLEHKSGVQWIVASDFWRQVLGYCNSKCTLYLLRESYGFVYLLLKASSKVNVDFAKNVVAEITQPLITNDLQTERVEINEAELRSKVTPTLRLITYVLEQCLKNDCCNDRHPEVSLMFLNDQHLECVVMGYMRVAQDETFFFDLSNLSFLVHIISLVANLDFETLSAKEMKDKCMKAFSILETNISKTFINNVIKLSHLLFYYWHFIAPRCPGGVCQKESKDQIILEDQIMLMQLVPICMVSWTALKLNLDTIEDEDYFRDMFFNKILKICCEYSLRMAYNWRNIIMDSPHIYSSAAKGINYIMQSRKYYNHEQGVMTFQNLAYVFKDIVNALHERPNFQEDIIQETNLVFAILDSIAIFIKEFDITWKDCVETICITEICIDFLQFSCFETRLIVQALKLLEITLKKYMAPNLVLLMDHTKDSTFDQIGPLLKDLLNEERWEIRDSAIEVVTTICSIAQSKFPSYQKVILQENFMEQILKFATTDQESYVRASAVRCLTEMVKVDAFWYGFLEEQNVPTKLVQVIHNETEAIVRTESATLISELCKTRRLSEEAIQMFAETMTYAVISDLHWEVKLRALNYWQAVMNWCLYEQGMMDGKFPSVTFSKERKKIVTLTEEEVRRRLWIVLERLSTCGCLGVFMAAMQDDCDIEVLKGGVLIVKELKAHLQRYGLLSNAAKPFKKPLSVGSSCFSMSPSTKSDVDDSMSGAPSQSIGSPSSSGVSSIVGSPSSSSGTSCCWSFINVKVVSPQDFLSFIRQDLDKLTERRSKWLNSFYTFGAILDDLLKCYEDDEDVNAMDCY